MSYSKLWFRKFVRANVDDIDIPADEGILQTHFTDFFGKWLQTPGNASILSFDALVRPFWDGFQAGRNSFHIFSVADGGHVPVNAEKERWFSQGIRFVAFIGSGQVFDRTEGSWTICVVGSSQLKSETAFLQVASWNGTAFRFYERSSIHGYSPHSTGLNGHSGSVATNENLGWVFMGVSTEAFTAENEYLGPFNGHVNGSLVMKELHNPWLHWMTNDGDFTRNLSAAARERFMEAPYLSAPGFPVLSRVTSAESMESFILTGISRWYDSRRNLDFDVQGGFGLRAQPSNIKRWMAHLLLTTTTNIVPAIFHSNDWRVDRNLFYNFELLNRYTDSGLMQEVSVPPFKVEQDHYTAVATALRLSLIQDVDRTRVPADIPIITLPKGTMGGGKETNSFSTQDFVNIEPGEGPGGMFTIVHPSYEDAQGVMTMQVLDSARPPLNRASLLSFNVFNALMMVDFWNPVYSWRMGVLMQYVPETTTFDPATRTYDLEKVFIENVKRSPIYRSGDRYSPEWQFISLLDAPIESHHSRIQAYLNTVDGRLENEQGIRDYLVLSESRRRIFRPVPLNEFGMTLPYALDYGSANVRWEMTEAGTIQQMSPRGLAFFERWTGTQVDGSLSGFDPRVIPTPDAYFFTQGQGSQPPHPTTGDATTAHRQRTQKGRGRCPFGGDQ